MSRSLVGGVVGGVIGYFVSGGNPAGVSYGYAIGSGVGGALDVAATRINRQGPRLGDAQTQTSAYGGPITRLYGTDRLSGSVEYLSARREVQSSTTERQGKGGPKVTTTSYSYYYDVVISLVDCPDATITGIRRIWGNGKLIYTNAENAGADSVIASVNIARSIRVYSGSQTQLPDPLLEAVYGVGNVPGFRGCAYIVFEDLLVDDFFGVLPQMEFEVVKNGAVATALVFGDTTVAVPSFNSSDFSHTRIASAGNASTVFRETSVQPNLGFSFSKGVETFAISNSGGALLSSSVPSPRVAAVYPTLRGLADIDAICCRDRDPVTGSDAERRNVVIGANGQRLHTYVMGPIVAQTTSGSWAKWGNRIVIAGSPGVHEITGSNSASYARVFDYDNEALLFETDIAPGSLVFEFVAMTPNYVWLVWATGSTPQTALRVLRSDTGSVVGDFTLPDRLGPPNVWWVEQKADDTLTVLSSDGLTPSANNFLMTRIRPDGTTSVLAAETTVGIGTGNYFPRPSSGSRGILAQGDTVVGLQEGFAGSPGGIGMRQWLFRFSSLSSSGVLLSSIVSAECAVAGLTGADIDVTELTDTVLGFKLTRNGGVRGGLEALQRAYYFDTIESAGKIKFPKRGRATTFTIPYADMGAGEGVAQPNPLPAVRSPDLELPVQVAVAYINPAADYQTGTEVARRLTTPGQAALTLEIPVVMTATKAAQCAEAAIYEAHASRTVRRVSVSRKYSALEASDTGHLTDKSGNLIRSRIVAIDTAGPVLTLDTVEDDGTVWTQTVAGAAGTVAQTGILLPSPTAAIFLDIPILQDSDNEAGLYVKLRPVNEANWRGAVLYRNTSTGDRIEVGTVLNVPSVGATTSVLAAPASFGIVDDLNTVTVQLASGDAESITHAALMEGLQGAWLIGNEVVQVRTAIYQSGTTWVLSGLLRGVRGTEWAATGHISGERAVKLDPAGMLRVSLEASDIGQAISYTAVSIGRSIGSSLSVDFTNTAIGLKPFAPVNLRGSRASGDWTISWDRRSRLRYSNPPSGDIALGEASELYDVLVYSSSGFTTVTRSFLGVTSATQIYTSAQQTTDFGSAQATIYIGVFQRSAVVGRGYELRGSLAG